MPSLTINPIDQGTNIITAADATAGITFSGSESGLDGQQIGLTLELSYGDTRFIGSIDTFAANGAWSIPVSPGLATTLPDGIYTATVFDAASQSSSNQPSQTVIVAQHATAFEVVGLAFNDINQQLGSEPFFLSIHQELAAEKAGLETLLNNDAFPGKPIDMLLRDISLEEKVLDFTPQSSGFVDQHTIDKLDQIQEKMAKTVQDSPQLLAQMPDNIGWTSPVDPRNAVLASDSHGGTSVLQNPAPASQLIFPT
jgi:hypothetical protein